MKLTKEQFIKKTAETAGNTGIELNNNQLEKLYTYKELLVEWNEKINLTAITDDEEIIVKHIIDSLQLVKYIKEKQSVIDVGTGAGLPGIILAIYFEGKIKITLFDALNKRILFLQHVIEALGLTGVEALHGRAEETSRIEDYREKYDVVVSRAVARLNVLMEITSPFVKVGGTCLYMKAEKTKQELDGAARATKELGIKYEDTIEYILNLNEEDFIHTIIVYTKREHIKDKYPRQFAKIKKSPL